MVEKRVSLKLRQSRATMEKAILGDAHSRTALDILVEKHGVNREKLLSLLCSIPYASNEPQPLVEGMSNRRVRALPDEIRNWADAIENVNSSPWCSPDRLPRQAAVSRNPNCYPKPLNFTLTPELAEIAAKKLRALPSDLRFYADHLRAWLALFHPTGKDRSKIGFGNAFRFRTWLTLRLLQLVRDSAKGPRYGTIATLLEAVYRAAGKPRTITEQDLGKLRTNNPWFTWVLQEFPGSDDLIRGLPHTSESN
jgi:hypothetical protein